MGRWILYGAVAAAALTAAGGGAYEMRGRAMRREDAARNAPCVDGSQIRLKDKRLLGFQLSGKQTDPPVLYFHGALGSRLEWPADRESAAEAGVWLIAVDRPGYGCSDPAPKRRVSDFADDVRQLADRFQLERFRIVAWSAGTVYAMACAWRMPDRVSKLDLVGTVAPESYPEGKDRRDKDLAFFAGLSQWAPGTAYTLLRKTVIRRETDPEWFEDRLARNLSPVDRALATSPQIRSLLKRSHATGQSRVGEGLLSDLESAGGEWGFTPAQVKTPVTMWQGTEDTLTPAVRNARLLTEFPKAELKKLPGEGHFLLYRYERQLLEE